LLQLSAAEAASLAAQPGTLIQSVESAWTEWEETFDPLGQVLEHYSYLREFVGKRASAGDGLLFYFVFHDDGAC